MSSVAAVCSALGHETRVWIVDRLCDHGSASITTLTTDAQMTRQAVTKHLNVLAGAGLVVSEKRGRERVWTLRPDPLSDAQRWMDLVSRRWDGRLARLKQLVEGDG